MRATWSLIIATLLLAFLFSLTVPVQGQGFSLCSDVGEEVIEATASKRFIEPDIVYNSKRNEFFFVYVRDNDGQTSVLGQRLQSDGTRIDNPIDIFPYGTGLAGRRKQYPVVAYNSINDHYMVAWEYDFRGDGTDWDVVARAVSGEGVPLGDYPFLLGASFGRDDSPHIAYNANDNLYVVVYELEADDDGRGIFATALNETHMLDEGILIGTHHIDREPFVAHHRQSNKYIIVWEWDEDTDHKTQIGSMLLSGSPLRAESTSPTLVGATIEVIGGQYTIAHDHDAKIVYSDKDNHYLLVWEVDGDSGEKEIVANRITPEGKPISGFRVLGSAMHPYDRKPSLAYAPTSNQFLVAFESGPDHVATNIRGIGVTSDTLRRTGDLSALNTRSQAEHTPTVAYSAQCHSVLTLWRSGADVVPTTTTTTGATSTADGTTGGTTGATTGGTTGATTGSTASTGATTDGSTTTGTTSGTTGTTDATTGDSSTTGARRDEHSIRSDKSFVSALEHGRSALHETPLKISRRSEQPFTPRSHTLLTQKMGAPITRSADAYQPVRAERAPPAELHGRFVCVPGQSVHCVHNAPTTTTTTGDHGDGSDTTTDRGKYIRIGIGIGVVISLFIVAIVAAGLLWRFKLRDKWRASRGVKYAGFSGEEEDSTQFGL